MPSHILYLHTHTFTCTYRAEALLQRLVGVVNQELLEAVGAKGLEAEDIEEGDGAATCGSSTAALDNTHSDMMRMCI